MHIPELRRLPIVLALFLSLVLLAACEDDGTEVARERDEVFEASPTTLADVPEGQDELRIAIEDGEFDADTIEVQLREPTVLIIENRDDTEYWFQIGDLVNGTAIPAGDVAQIEFTTPTSNEQEVLADYEAELLSGEGGDVVDTMAVDVLQGREIDEP